MPTSVRCACVDIGSNTTRLLVADVDDGRLVEVLAQRAFTRVGRGVGPDGTIDATKVAEVCEVVSAQGAAAGISGADRLRVVATAAIRVARNGAELCDAVRDAAGVAVDVLTGEQEA